MKRIIIVEKKPCILFSIIKCNRLLFRFRLHCPQYMVAVFLLYFLSYDRSQIFQCSNVPMCIQFYFSIGISFCCLVHTKIFGCHPQTRKHIKQKKSTMIFVGHILRLYNTTHEFVGLSLPSSSTIISFLFIIVFVIHGIKSYFEYWICCSGRN